MNECGGAGKDETLRFWMENKTIMMFILSGSLKSKKEVYALCIAPKDVPSILHC